MLLLGVHSGGHKPPDVEPIFYEVGILGEGISDSRGGALAENFLGYLNRFTTNGGFTRGTWSLRLRARKSRSGGLDRLGVMRYVSRA
jgi:hypothetical protein